MATALSWNEIEPARIELTLDAANTVDVARAACAGLGPAAYVVIRWKQQAGTSWHIFEVRSLQIELKNKPGAESLLCVLDLPNFYVRAVDATEPPPDGFTGRVLVVAGDDALGLVLKRGSRRSITPGAAGTGTDLRKPREALPLPSNVDPAWKELLQARRLPAFDSMETAPRLREVRDQPRARTIPAELTQSDTLHWNTSFPDDAATQRSKTLLAGIPYVLRTQLDASPDRRSLTPITADLSSHYRAGDAVDVAFRVEAKGAKVRKAGTQDGFASTTQSDPLHCTKGQGTQPFEIEVMAERAGPVTIDLSLYARSAYVTTAAIALHAVEIVTPPAPSAASGLISHASLARTREAAAGVLVRRENERYRIEAQIGTVRSQAALPAASYATDIESLLSNNRQQLVALSERYQPDRPESPGFGIDNSGELLRQFAAIGRKLHRAIFGDGDGDSTDLRSMAQTLAARGRQGQTGLRAPRLQIDAELLPIPWGLLYDAESTNPPDLLGFWGYRFQIDRVVRICLTARHNPTTTLDLSSRTTLHSVFNPGIDAEQSVKVIEQQKEFFKNQGGAAPILSRAEFERLLKGEDPIQLLYFFCHAITSDTSPFHHKLSEDEAKLQIDAQPISVTEMWALRRSYLAGSPLVFLNACSSAQGDRAFQSVFVEHFIKHWGARGVIGTDWKVPTIFADLFARSALEKLLVEARPLGDAFHEVTVDAMNQGNPFGLIYSIFAPPEIVVTYSQENRQ